MIRYGIIILAAGASSRLGKPKQLLTYQHKTLIKNILDAALQCRNSITIVVTGAVKDEVEQELKNTQVVLCYNDQWQSGMSSSIRAGVSKMKVLQPQVEACILTVCDQPYISANVLMRLIEKHEAGGHNIVASSYADTVGTPALFSRDHFDELLNLQGEEGAKKLLKKYGADVSLVQFDRGEIDIDTVEDYSKLI
jgi:molybdenum cofactor cytidylyltransferase